LLPEIFKVRCSSVVFNAAFDYSICSTPAKPLHVSSNVAGFFIASKVAL